MKKKSRTVKTSSFLVRWRWRFFGAGVAATLFAVGTAGLWPIASGWTDPPFVEKLRTQSVLGAARRANASRWAANEMRQAEASMKAAAAAYRFEEVKFLPFRDFRGARAALESAEVKLDHAM